MYGREHGLLEAVARGAALGTSKQAGHLEPFSISDVMIAKGVAIDKLAVARLIETPLRASQPSFRLPLFAICGACADLVIALTRPGISDDRIFFLLRELIHALTRLPEHPSSTRARCLYAATTLKLLGLVGFAPPLDTPLLVFMRDAALSDVLRVTAPREAFNAASAYVEAAIAHTPLNAAPHGAKTIATLLGSDTAFDNRMPRGVSYDKAL